MRRECAAVFDGQWNRHDEFTPFIEPGRIVGRHQPRRPTHATGRPARPTKTALSRPHDRRCVYNSEAKNIISGNFVATKTQRSDHVLRLLRT